MELAPNDPAHTKPLEVTVFRDYLRQLGIREGDRGRLKPQRVRVFGTDPEAARLAA